MKILQVSPGYSPAIGVVKEHVRTIGNPSAREHEVNVCTLDPSCEFPEKEGVNGVMIRRVKNFSANNPHHISYEIFRERRQ